MRLARVFGLAAAGVLAAAALAAADPPKVQAEYRVPAGQPLRVVVSGKDVGYKAAFADDQAFFDELVPKEAGERRFLFQAATPGRYAVVFWTKGETDGAFTTIVVGDGKAPQPDPKDKKAVDPPAVQKIGRVVIVTDAGNPKAAFLVNAYRNNRAFNDYYAKGRRDHQWGLLASVDKDVVDKDGNPPREFAPLIRASRDKTYPQYFVVAADGTVLKQGDLPADPAALVATLQDLGGR